MPKSQLRLGLGIGVVLGLALGLLATVGGGLREMGSGGSQKQAEVIPRVEVTTEVAQTPAIVMRDPLRDLFAKDRPKEKKIRLHVTLMRVPIQEAALAMHAAKGGTTVYWRQRLSAWSEAGNAEGVADFRTEGEDLEAVSQGREKFRFIGQSATAHFWMEQQERVEDKTPPPDPNDLLQELSEADVGQCFESQVIMNEGWQQARVKMRLFYCPEPAKRPTTTWPLPLFTAPRYLFRSWALDTSALCPVDEPFLLGTQMEAPHDGQVHTGHVLMAFGRITLPDKAAGQAGHGQPDAEGTKHLQTWSLAVEKEAFLAWFVRRESADADDAMLQAWLLKAAAKEGVELLSAAAVAVDAGGRSELSSTLQWQDGQGFEPGGTRTEFRVLPESDGMYALPHELFVEMQNASTMPATAEELAVDPDANSPTHRKPGAAWLVDFSIGRPSGAATWKKWKSAMERDESDPNAMEIAETDMDGPGEILRSNMMLLPGRTIMAGACLKKDRVQVTFVRLVQEGAVVHAEAPAPTHATSAWVIETPDDWQNKLLGEAKPDFEQLGLELLEAATGGGARVVSFCTQEQLQDSEGRIAATDPKIFFGGQYVNTAPAVKGIFFNPRSVGYERIGDVLETRSMRLTNSVASKVSLVMKSAGVPEWRHWGLWQPALKETNAENSGLEQPVFPASVVDLDTVLMPGKLQVIGVMRTSSLGSLAKDTPSKLRWYVARRDGPVIKADPDPNAPARFAGYLDDPHAFQALVVAVAAARVLPEDPASAAKLLLDEVRKGDLPVLDLITVRKAGARQEMVATGWNFYFTNGRERSPQERDSDPTSAASFKAPAVMPEGTGYASQVDLLNRIVGFSLRLEGNEWEIERDAHAPQIVTDTFHDARLEWPYPEVEKMPPATVSVQRPIFAIQSAKGPLPTAGQPVVKRLAEDTVLILRMLE